ncbi:NERD domain protein [[Leptolyngbya] sp. PCC 7376]|uniref:nuclease-related domain-containing protein n=1 Tax=[Leptolyngbya] sp. PCC 7376 TaxID=111781 RepID=UPI00029EF0FA|nr:nuclease-related domain-containing protein [[Leptolyngbya] sp. PCC 7376]AFY39763.1 NERD domain protein [[Leptolyngbya] sp. PCC 7376]
MKQITQSPQLQEFFAQSIQQKKNEQTQKIYRHFGNNQIGDWMAGANQWKNWVNELKGNYGEELTASLFNRLPDSWAMGRNIFIPTNHGKLTEVDLLIVGTRGIFLIEVKTWKGSFSAYKDSWKRRVGRQWVSIQKSPTKQNQYHQRMFKLWIKTQNLEINPTTISAPVIFPAAQWLGVKQCSVPTLSSLVDLVRLIQQKQDCLDHFQVEKVTEALKEVTIPSNKIQKPVKAQNLPRPKPKPILRKKI